MIVNNGVVTSFMHGDESRYDQETIIAFFVYGDCQL
jgi:hypothetical protein